MNANEYALADGLIQEQLRSYVEVVYGGLAALLKLCLFGWLIVGGLELLRQLGNRRCCVRLAFLAILLVSQLVLAGELAQSGQMKSLAPKSKQTALKYSLTTTLAPAAVGGLLMLTGQKVGPFSGGKGYGGTDDELTIFGLILGSAGVVFGPGTGHAYAGRSGHFWGGAAIRAGTGLLGLGAIVGLAMNSGGMGLGSSRYSSSDNDTGAIFVIAAAGAGLVTSIVYDLATTGRSVDQYNRSHGFSAVHVEPCYLADLKAPGLVFTFSF